MSGQQSWKDICDKVAGPEPDPVVYEFKRKDTKKLGFTEKANQEGTGVYKED
jgi:hypothetical protein